MLAQTYFLFPFWVGKNLSKFRQIWNGSYMKDFLFIPWNVFVYAEIDSFSRSIESCAAFRVVGRAKVDHRDLFLFLGCVFWLSVLSGCVTRLLFHLGFYDRIFTSPKDSPFDMSYGGVDQLDHIKVGAYGKLCEKKNPFQRNIGYQALQWVDRKLPKVLVQLFVWLEWCRIKQAIFSPR